MRTISAQSKTLANATSKTYVDKLIDETAMAISGNSGGYVVIHSSKGGNHPDEILIMDEPELENAKRIWRWNMSGLCYTDNHYSSFADTVTIYDGENEETHTMRIKYPDNLRYLISDINRLFHKFFTD